MKLNKTQEGYVANVFNVCDKMKVDNVVIEEGKVRGMDATWNVVILHTYNIPNFKKTIATYDARSVAQALKGANDPVFSVVRGKGFVDSIKVGDKVLPMSNPLHVKAPRVIHDLVEYGVDVPKSTIPLLQKVVRGKRGYGIWLRGYKRKLSLIVLDETIDTIKYSGRKFEYKYPFNALLNLLKQGDGHLSIGGKGVLKSLVGGLEVYVLPTY